MSKDMVGEYTEVEWEEEMKSDWIVFQFPSGPFAFGTVIPCPSCKTIGFYGPRKSPSEGEPTRKYRACKFCGLWQEAWGNGFDSRGGDPYRCIHLLCTNENCKTYGWTASDEGKSCEICRGQTMVAKWASDDPGHTFHRFKDEIIRNLK